MHHLIWFTFLSYFGSLYAASPADTLLIEAEAFQNQGGWKTDTQFIETMGSPYLLAHGLGVPVSDATTTLNLPSSGTYRVWARTMDWVARWNAPGTPGTFEILINGKSAGEFGDKNSDWFWQKGGTLELSQGKSTLSLRDLKGFNGRCDAILLTKDENFVPPKNNGVLPEWRRSLSGVPTAIQEEGQFDLVVVGGGYGGMGAAMAAARMGAKVALIQNRKVLGGNGSSEVRVWAKGNTPNGLYPLGDIINELTDHAKASPGTYEEFGDKKKETIFRAEKNVTLYLGHHGFRVEMDGDRIKAVHALEVSSGIHRRFEALNFTDATGHGFLAELAGADGYMQPKGRMGMSNMWMFRDTDSPKPFPETPWALDLKEGDFPYPVRHHAQWFWESGFDKHPVKDLEAIRDWNLRANFGAWNAIKNKGVYSRNDRSGKSHVNSEMGWMAYVGGTRETKQYYGDVILTEEDILDRRLWSDGCVLTTWSIDLHYPKKQYSKKFPDNPFISIAEHGKGVDRKRGYPIPYRCFYSRNVKNLFLAGRMLSLTHKALGTVRVMKTLGMVGVVTGKASAICSKYQCTPQEVYTKHLPELIESMSLPGKAIKENLNSKANIAPLQIKAWVPSPPAIIMKKIDKNDLEGIVLDDEDAKLEGEWTEGRGLQGFIGNGYRYHSGNGKATYRPKLPKAGKYEIRLSYGIHENRSDKVSIEVQTETDSVQHIINQQKRPDPKNAIISLGKFNLNPDNVKVVFSQAGKSGFVHIDTVQFIPVK